MPTDRTRTTIDTWTTRFLDHHLRGQVSDPLIDRLELVGTLEAIGAS